MHQSQRTHQSHEVKEGDRRKQNALGDSFAIRTGVESQIQQSDDQPKKYEKYFLKKMFVIPGLNSG